MSERAAATLTQDPLVQNAPAEPVREAVSSPARLASAIASPGVLSDRNRTDVSAVASPREAAENTDPQRTWAALPLRNRLAVIASVRDLIALDSAPLTSSISSDLPRSAADTMAAEVLPLLAACRFLERSAAQILRPRALGRQGRPFWLPGVSHPRRRGPISAAG